MNCTVVKELRMTHWIRKVKEANMVSESLACPRLNMSCFREIGGPKGLISVIVLAGLSCFPLNDVFFLSCHFHY